MSDFIVDIIDLNERIDYSVFVTLFCSYLLTLWLVISVWVGTDAWKRYENKYLAILFFFLTFLLNFPILIFYFIVRPETKFEDYDEWEVGGVNVPMVNFVGKKGVDMVLQLKINPSKIVPNDNDMKIDVSWESNKDEMKLATSQNMHKNKNLKELKGPTKRADRKVVNVFSKWRGQAKKSIQKVKEVAADYGERKKPKIDKKEAENAEKGKGDSKKKKELAGSVGKSKQSNKRKQRRSKKSKKKNKNKRKKR
ncbi:hypothetical protein GF389_05180 [Candidatus Dojkabacteria bacterium]|nr:hypothetical protein [Candidatus Dojkabacteria bacterium]